MKRDTSDFFLAHEDDYPGEFHLAIKKQIIDR